MRNAGGTYHSAVEQPLNHSAVSRDRKRPFARAPTSCWYIFENLIWFAKSWIRRLQPPTNQARNCKFKSMYYVRTSCSDSSDAHHVLCCHCRGREATSVQSHAGARSRTRNEGKETLRLKRMELHERKVFEPWNTLAPFCVRLTPFLRGTSLAMLRKVGLLQWMPAIDLSCEPPRG